MSNMIHGVHHIAVKPTKEQYQKTVSFYTGLFGMTVKQSWGDPDYPCLMVSCGDNSCMEVLPQEPDFTCPETGPLAHIAFATDKVDELVEAARAAGYPIQVEPKDVLLDKQQCRIAFLYGPTGEEIELFYEM